MSDKQQIPYKIYLEEQEMPRQWYNVRADMKKKPAPILNPALGQFCIQNQEQVGNYPVMNVYANFYVRSLRLKLFAQYQHFNASFMNKQYYEMPGYPMGPDMFRAGLAWHFYK